MAIELMKKIKKKRHISLAVYSLLIIPFSIFLKIGIIFSGKISKVSGLLKSLAMTFLCVHAEIHYRSSPPEVFLGKGILKICSKFTGEHLCQIAIAILSRTST